MTERELIDIINALIDADTQGECPVLNPKDIARRAIDRCGEGVFTTEAVTDLVCQIFTIRCEPWKGLPGTTPRLREWKEGVVRLAPKPSVMEILEAGREAREPLAVTLARVRRAYPRLTEAAIKAEIGAYLAWLDSRIAHNEAEFRELTRAHAIAKPALDEDPSLTIGEALKVMAGRGNEAARRELAS